MINAPGDKTVERIRLDDRRVVVIDDDPTGTQTVSGVDVVLRPDAASFDHFFSGAERCIYVLSNSRALSRAEAVRHVREIVALARTCAERRDQRVAFILRGDSTLRGHVFAEIDAVGNPRAVTLFVPAFPEGGRTTVDGVQWIAMDGRRVNVADTEFARDVAFGYRSRSLVGWVAEVGGHRAASVVPLERIRSAGASAVRDAILTAPPGSVVIPEAASRRDLEATLVGLLDAEAEGRDVVVRSASTLASMRGGLAPRIVAPSTLAEPGHVLVVCGSHTRASTEQLRHLVARTGIEPIEVSAETPRTVWESGRLLAELVALVAAGLARDRFAIVATSRTRRESTDGSGLGSHVMRMLIDVVAAIVPNVQGVIAKGGVTSAEVARVAMRAPRARVAGQLAPGIALWDVPHRHGGGVPLAVIPGNVGGPSTLADVARAFGVAA